MDKATKRQVIKRSEQQKLDLIDQWEKSGLSIKRFCNQHQFSDSLFHSWLNKYRRQNQKAATQNKEFISLQITGSSPMRAAHPAAPYAEVVLANAHRITFYQPVAVEYLRTLLS